VSRNKRSSKTSRLSKRSPKQDQPRLRLPRVSGQALRVWTNRLFLAAVVIGSGVGAALGLAPLKQRVAELRADPLVVKFDWPAMRADGASASETSVNDSPRTWLPLGERRRLVELVSSAAALDPFDVESLDRARGALTATGWFHEPPRLRRATGGVLEVSGRWRRPGAVVRAGQWDYLVSQEGRLLSLRYKPGQAGPLRVILNTFSGPPIDERGRLRFGSTWSGGDVEAALATLALLRRSPAWDRIAAIDASAFLDEGSLTIVTQSGGRIVWGAPPGAEAPGEVGDQTKLDRVAQALDNPAWKNADRPRVHINMPKMLIDARLSDE